MKVAVVGANGQLGTDVCRSLIANGDEAVGLTHSDIEVSNLDDVSSVLNDIHADVIINTSAMHHVEKCELEPEKAYRINGLGARNLATVCRDRGLVLIHVSTDYVFDGEKAMPYVESDIPHPLNIYGHTKLSGEMFVQSLSEKYFVVRTSALYGHSQCRAKGGLNFVDLMLKLAKERDHLRVVDNEVVSPTSTTELARHLVALTRSDEYGLYHATAEGSCSWYAFAKEALEIVGSRTPIIVAEPGEFATKARRPLYSVLENSRLKQSGINTFSFWRDGLRQYLELAA